MKTRTLKLTEKEWIRLCRILAQYTSRKRCYDYNPDIEMEDFAEKLRNLTAGDADQTETQPPSVSPAKKTSPNISTDEL